MVSPSPYCSDIFRRAFGFEGPMLEAGYPRNDVLAHRPGRPPRRGPGPARPDRRGPGGALRRRRWREYLGVRTGKPVYVDPERLTAAMPDTVLLVRGHYNSTGQRDLFEGHPRIHDVTRYPDVAELFLVADALVTDYSSVMFDFVLTDRPVVLLVPDLEQYRDVERGFYSDIESRSPRARSSATPTRSSTCCSGPTCTRRHGPAFRTEFCPVGRRPGVSARRGRPARAVGDEATTRSNCSTARRSVLVGVELVGGDLAGQEPHHPVGDALVGLRHHEPRVLRTRRVADRRERSRHDRQTERPGLQDDHRLSLVVAGEHEAVTGHDRERGCRPGPPR